MDNLANIIKWKYNLKPGEDFYFEIVADENGEETTVIGKWSEEVEQPTIDYLLSLEEEYLAWVNANEYKDKRKAEYVSVPDQLDMMYWDQVNGTTTWKDHIESVKNKYPKP